MSSDTKNCKKENTHIANFPSSAKLAGVMCQLSFREEVAPQPSPGELALIAGLLSELIDQLLLTPEVEIEE